MDYSTCAGAADGCSAGFRLVDDEYVSRIQPLLPPLYDPPRDAEEEQANAAFADAIESRREALRATVFPCAVHNPDLFARWRDGSWPPHARRRPRRTAGAAALEPLRIIPPAQQLALGVLDGPDHPDEEF